MISALLRFPKSLVKPVAMRYLAGECLEDAVRVVRSLNARKAMATVDVLVSKMSPPGTNRWGRSRPVKMS